MASAGVQYQTASVEFRLITQRYFKESWYRINRGFVQHRQLNSMALYQTIGLPQELRESAVADLLQLDKLYRSLLESQEFTGFKAQQSQRRDKMSDQDKIKFLSQLGQGNGAFKSLEDIVDLMQAIGRTPQTPTEKVDP